MSKDEELALVQRTAETLGEHFDTVHIFVTRHDEGGEGGTVNMQGATGNWFARYGQIRNWIVKEEEKTRIDTRKAYEKDEE